MECDGETRIRLLTAEEISLRAAAGLSLCSLDERACGQPVEYLVAIGDLETACCLNHAGLIARQRGLKLPQQADGDTR